jgi:hypothetical protein
VPSVPLIPRRCLSAKAGGTVPSTAERLPDCSERPAVSLPNRLDRQAAFFDSQDRATSPLNFNQSTLVGHTAPAVATPSHQRNDTWKLLSYTTHSRSAKHSADVQMKVKQCEALLKTRAHSQQACTLEKY